MADPSEINCRQLVPYPVLRCTCAYGCDVLALELGDQLGETLRVSLNSDGREDSGDVLLRRRGVATLDEEEVCCEVLHFGWRRCQQLILATGARTTFSAIERRRRLLTCVVGVGEQGLQSI